MTIKNYANLVVIVADENNSFITQSADIDQMELMINQQFNFYHYGYTAKNNNRLIAEII